MPHIEAGRTLIALALALAAAMPAHAIYKWVDKKVCLDDKDRPAHIAELKRAVGEFCD